MDDSNRIEWGCLFGGMCEAGSNVDPMEVGVGVKQSLCLNLSCLVCKVGRIMRICM